MDSLGRTLLQRVQELMAARPDMDRKDFGRAIGRPTPSWLSEFFAGKRTTNDLRLVVRMARVFGVSVSFLVNERAPEMDAETATLLAAWRDLDQRKDRDAVLGLALALRPSAPDAPGSAARRDAAGDSTERKPEATSTPRPPRRR